MGTSRSPGSLSIQQKVRFEISEIPRALWNGTFRLHRPDPSHHWFSREMTSEKRAQKFLTDDALLQRSGQCFGVIVPRGKFASANQKHYPDLGSDTSPIRNFCASFPDIISQGNRWWRRDMSAVFSGLSHCPFSYCSCNQDTNERYWHGDNNFDGEGRNLEQTQTQIFSLD